MQRQHHRVHVHLSGIAAVLVLGLAGSCRSGSPSPSESPVEAPEAPVVAVPPPEPTPAEPASPEPTAPEPTAPETPNTTPGAGADAGGSACRSDADCVPASCCHPDSCVPRAQAPSCSDMVCTRECRASTLDCGGRCLCRDGVCQAQLNDLPSP